MRLCKALVYVLRVSTVARNAGTLELPQQMGEGQRADIRSSRLHLVTQRLRAAEIVAGERSS